VTIFRPATTSSKIDPPRAATAAATFLRRSAKADTETLAFPPPRPWTGKTLTYIVNDACIKCKYMDCVEVCPVDCFYEGDNMLVIHPDECNRLRGVRAGMPVDAIKPDTEPGLEKWLKVNADFAKTWPNITTKRAPPADAKEFEGVPGKFEKYFSPEPGEGD